MHTDDREQRGDCEVGNIILEFSMDFISLGPHFGFLHDFDFFLM